MTIECHRESCRQLAVWCSEVSQCLLKDVLVIYVVNFQELQGSRWYHAYETALLDR